MTRWVYNDDDDGDDNDDDDDDNNSNIFLVAETMEDHDDKVSMQ